MTDLQRVIEAEIIAFHDFFVAWLTGKADPNALQTEMAARLAAGFTIIPPSGTIMSRDTLLSAFGGLYATKPDIRIKIREVRILHHLNGHVVASYTEWQHGGGADNGRQSTVVMTDCAPFQWLNVHETGLPADNHPRGAFEF